jgi:SPW repeat
MWSTDNRATVTSASQLALGLLLLVAPWAVGFAAEPSAAWPAWVTGALIAVAGAVGLAVESYGAAWANLVLGLWAILAPWALGFATVRPAMWSHVVLGALAALAAAAELWAEHRSRPRLHA